MHGMPQLLHKAAKHTAHALAQQYLLMMPHMEVIKDGS
jgi:hypothetical protein